MKSYKVIFDALSHALLESESIKSTKGSLENWKSWFIQLPKQALQSTIESGPYQYLWSTQLGKLVTAGLYNSMDSNGCNDLFDFALRTKNNEISNWLIENHLDKIPNAYVIALKNLGNSKVEDFVKKIEAKNPLSNEDYPHAYEQMLSTYSWDGRTYLEENYLDKIGSTFELAAKYHDWDFLSAIDKKNGPFSQEIYTKAFEEAIMNFKSKVESYQFIHCLRFFLKYKKVDQISPEAFIKLHAILPDFEIDADKYYKLLKTDSYSNKTFDAVLERVQDKISNSKGHGYSHEVRHLTKLLQSYGDKVSPEVYSKIFEFEMLNNYQTDSLWFLTFERNIKDDIRSVLLNKHPAKILPDSLLKVLNFALENADTNLLHTMLHKLTDNFSIQQQMRILDKLEYPWNSIKHLAEKNTNIEIKDLYIKAIALIEEYGNKNIDEFLAYKNAGNISPEVYSKVFMLGAIEYPKFTAALAKTDIEQVSNDDYSNVVKVARFNMDLVKLLVERGADKISPEAFKMTIEKLLNTGHVNVDLLNNILKHIKVELEALDNNKIKFGIASLARDGEVEILRALGKYINTKSLHAVEQKLFDANRDSCFSSVNLSKAVDVEKISFEPLTVVQNYCDTLVKMKDGKVLKLKGQKAEEVYSFLVDKSGKEAPKTTCEFTEHLGAGHAFTSLKCPGTKVHNQGFYPSAFTLESMDNSAYITSTTIPAIIAGVSFSLAHLATKILTSCLPLGSYKPIIEMGVPALFASATTTYAYKNFGPEIHNVIGQVKDETDWLNDYKDQYQLKLTFIVDEKQAKDILDYIYAVKSDCENHKFDKCTYNIVERNCADFAQDVFHAAGIGGSLTDFVSYDQAASTPYGATTLNAFKFLDSDFIEPL